MHCRSSVPMSDVSIMRSIIWSTMRFWKCLLGNPLRFGGWRASRIAGGAVCGGKHGPAGDVTGGSRQPVHGWCDQSKGRRDRIRDQNHPGCGERSQEPHYGGERGRQGSDFSDTAVSVPSRHHFKPVPLTPLRSLCYHLRLCPTVRADSVPADTCRECVPGKDSPCVS